MAYLPGSYESKLNTLFKPNYAPQRNYNNYSNITTFLYDGVTKPKYPIYVPSYPVDNNVLEVAVPPTYPHIHPKPTTEEPSFMFDLDIDGNLAIPSGHESEVGKHYNNTVWNISSIVNELLNQTNTNTTVSTNLDLSTSTSTDTNVFGSFEDENSTTNSTIPPSIFKTTGPIASTELLITYGFFVLFLAILGIISNSATIHVLFKAGINLHIKMHYTNMTILSLAVVNLMGSIFVGMGGGINMLSIGFVEHNPVLVTPPSFNIVTSSITLISPVRNITINNNPTNVTEIANLISAYANVTLAKEEDAGGHDLEIVADSNDSNATVATAPTIFPALKRKVWSKKIKRVTEKMCFCKLQCFFSNLCSFVSIWTLAVITADRYFAHNWPLKYNQAVDRKKFAIFIVYIWLQAILFSSLSLEFWSRDKLLDRGPSSGLCHCSVNWLFIPRDASMGLAFFKLFAFIWMSIFPYSVIFTLNLITVIKMLLKPVTEATPVTPLHEESDHGPGNPISRFFLSNPQQEQMMWRVIPPPLSPQCGNAPIHNLFSSSFAGTQQRRSRLLELHRISLANGGKLTPMNTSNIKASTKSVLNCYLAVIFAYIWLHTFPSCLTFTLFLADKTDSFVLTEMIALLFKLIGFSVNVAIYFWLREDFHEAFSTLFSGLCTCDGLLERKRTGPSRFPGDEWY